MSSSASPTRGRNRDLNDAERWVAEAFARVGKSLEPDAVDAFAVYLRLLTKWNEKINLTAIRDPQSVVTRHFVDSALVLDHAPAAEHAVVADIGSGAGFPGVPFAILRPDAHVVLWEPVVKKAAFLETVVATLRLRNTAVVPRRVEPKQIPIPYAATFDGVVSRYTASLTWLATCARAMVHPGGWLVAHKYAGAKEEAELNRLAAMFDAPHAEWRSDARAEPNRCFAVIWFP
jgi:16S rRNA (guanine527-N7)-methyltransferase